jgi:ABC-type glycerol-3-phosphate transport system substrate-binding protein
MKNKQSLILAAVLMVGALSSCGQPTASSGSSDTGNKEIQVKLYKAGWGQEWLDATIAKFQEAYKAEGYTVNIVESSSTVIASSESEILTASGKKKNPIDLYFTSNVSINNLIYKSKSVLRTSDTTLLEDMDDILDSKAIGFDKQEEAATIRSRLYQGFDSLLTYRGSVSAWQGKDFTLPWATSGTSLLVNPAVLAKYGVEVPLTSNEFVQAIQKIATAGKADGVYPYAWAGGNASGYWNYLFGTWFAQYQGLSGYKDFLALNPASGTTKDNGYDVYNDLGMKESLNAMRSILNLDYSADGAVSMQHLEAQHDFLEGKAAFMINGDWLLNEMKSEYSTEAKSCKIVKAPLLSSIGKEAGLSDEQFHQVIAAIDSGKTYAETKAMVSGLSEDNFKRISEARDLYSCLGSSHQILIPSYADAKVGAKLFVRFLLSEDGCRLFHNTAYGNLPFTFSAKEGDSSSVFEDADAAFLKKGKSMAFNIEDMGASEIRSKANVLLFNHPSWASPSTFKSMMIDSTLTGDTVYTKEAEYVKSNWSSFIQYAGL